MSRIKLIKRCGLVVWLITACMIILFAVILSFARIVTPYLDQHKSMVEHWASRVLRAPVYISHIRASWEGFTPELQFTKVMVLNKSNGSPLLKINQLNIGIDLWQSIWQRKLLPSRLYISGANIALLKNKKGKILVKGLHLNLAAHQQVSAAALDDIITWLLTQTDIKLDHVNVLLKKPDGSLLSVHDLRLMVDNHFALHRIGGVASLQQHIPTRIKFVFDLSDLNLKKHTFDGRLYLRVHQLLLSQWAAFFSINLSKKVTVQRAKLNGQLWVSWTHGHLQHMQSLFKLQHAKLLLNKKQVKLNKLKANLAWQRKPLGWELLGDHLKLIINGHQWQENKFGLRWQRMDKRRVAFKVFKLNYLRLQDLFNFIHLPGIPVKLKALLYHIHPKGELKQLYLAIKSQPLVPATYYLVTQFKHLSLKSWQQLPAIVNLSGQVAIAPQKGALLLTSHQGKIFLPRLFRRALPFSLLQARVHWHCLQGSSCHWQVKHFLFDDHHLRLSGKINLAASSIKNIKVALLAHLELNDLRRIYTYLPGGILKPNSHLYAWLKSAFRGGEITKGTISLQGKLSQFPFKSGGGDFTANLQLKNTKFLFAPHWPEVKNLDASVQFHNGAMTINASQASMLGNWVQHVTASIANLTHSVLIINANIKSHLKNGLDFLRKSPLQVAQDFKDITMQGLYTLSLYLHIPLYQPHFKVITKGRVHVDNANFAMPKWQLYLKKINGQLTFTGHGLMAQNLQAYWLGQPLTLNITTMSTMAHRSRLNISIGAHVSLATLQRHFGLSFMHFFQGDTDLRALLKISNDASNIPSSLSVFSDLRGVSIRGVPAPFAKTTGMATPLLMRFIFAKKMPLRIKMRYANILSCALQFKNVNNQPQLSKGEIVLGSGSASWQKLPGLLIDGQLATINWRDWQSFLSPLLASKKKTGSSNSSRQGLIRKIELTISRIRMWGQLLNNVYVTLLAQSHGWLGNVKSKKLTGVFFIPQDKNQPWRINCQHLFLSKIQSGRKHIIDLSALPSLDITCKNFFYADKPYGKIQLITHPDDKGLMIKKMVIQSPYFSLALNGWWHHHDDHASTYILGSFASNNIGKFLREWKLSSSMAEGRGVVTYSLRWPGSPMDYRMINTVGDIKLNLQDGRLLHLGNKVENELGLGRLLNIFSIGSLAKRLTLNFSDLKKGFSFDVLRGDLRLDHGNAGLQYAYLKGPVASVSASGQIGFSKKNYNLTLTVVPYVTSSLPLIVGVIGGPIAGAAAWVVNKIAEPEIGKAVGSSYHLIGSWRKPKIIKLPRPVYHLPPVVEKANA